MQAKPIGLYKQMSIPNMFTETNIIGYELQMESLIVLVVST